MTKLNAPAAASLALAHMREEGLAVTQGTAAALVREIHSGQSWGFLALALPSCEPLGMIQVRRVMDPCCPRLEVWRFYVKPGARGRRLGWRLVEAVIDSLSPEEDLPLFISTVGPLRRSFAKLGFETVSLVHAAPVSRIREAMRR